MFMESWLLRVSCKETEAQTLQKLNLLLIFTFYYKNVKYQNIFNLGIKTILYLKYICINSLVGV